MSVPLASDSTGGGPLLLLVHGITENRSSFDPIVADLAADHRVVRVDLRGHGESPRADGYAIEDLASDLDPFVDEPPLVVGHSLGGMVATAYAAAFEVRGVVNVDQSLDLGGLQAQVQQAAPLLRGPEFPAVMTQLFDSLRGELGDDEWHRLNALRRLDQDVVLGVWSVLLDNDPAGLEAVVGGMTATVSAPYLALDGIDPGPTHGQWLHARIPQAVLEVWPGAGHYPHLVDPERFTARVREFEVTLP